MEIMASAYTANTVTGIRKRHGATTKKVRTNGAEEACEILYKYLTETEQ